MTTQQKLGKEQTAHTMQVLRWIPIFTTTDRQCERWVVTAQDGVRQSCWVLAATKNVCVCVCVAVAAQRSRLLQPQLGLTQSVHTAT